jgi:hypothetical protein
MNVNRISLLALLVAVPLIGLGCDFGPPTAPVTPLAKDQVKGVLNCQAVIKAAGQIFVKTKLDNLEDCLDDVLATEVKFENKLISTKEHDEELAENRRSCTNHFTLIGRASTNLVNAIHGACDPVGTIIASTSGYDPLEFGFQGLDFTSVNDVVAAVCQSKEAAVDAMVAVEVPRMGSLLDVLGPDFESNGSTETSEGNSESSEEDFPKIQLDEGCYSSTLPLAG